MISVSVASGQLEKLVSSISVEMNIYLFAHTIQ